MKSAVARCLLAVFGMLLSTHALADMPPSKRTRQEKTFVFGDTKIKQSFDSMKDPMSPDFIVKVYAKGRLMLQLNDAAFDAYFASPDKQIFVGLSNSGWPATAVVIFDQRGRILLLAEHGFSRFDYCSESSTFIKEWYDAKDPQLRFPVYKAGSGRAPGITLRDCHGQTVDLLDVVSKAAEHGDMSLRNEIRLLHGTR